MKKITPGILISGILMIMFIIPVTADKGKSLMNEVIENIEHKYDEIRNNASEVKARGVKVAQEIRFIQPEDNVIYDYNKLKQIALVRHGEPDIKKDGKFTRAQASEYLKCYDTVCIIVPEKPFFKLKENEQVKIFSSPLNRALTTAQYLCGPEREITVSSEFREFESKIDNHKSSKKLPIKIWTGAARLKWMLGIGNHRDIESFKEAKKRAKNAAQMLDEASEENQKVLLTAHGMLNRYIKKNLEKKGWKVVEETGNNYLGTTILVKID